MYNMHITINTINLRGDLRPLDLYIMSNDNIRKNAICANDNNIKSVAIRADIIV